MYLYLYLCICAAKLQFRRTPRTVHPYLDSLKLCGITNDLFVLIVRTEFDNLLPLPVFCSPVSFDLSGHPYLDSKLCGITNDLFVLIVKTEF